MELFLWRHADALSGSNDFDRELSQSGHNQARRMAERFRELAGPPSGPLAGFTDLRIFASPSKRTRQTLAHFCKDESIIKFCMPLYENAYPEETLDILAWPDITLPALIVGHQPQIGIFADYLLAGAPHPLSFGKCDLWWLRLTPGQKNAQLVQVLES